MNIKSIKGTVAKILTAGVLAGAVAFATPTRANAQEVVFAGAAHPVLARYGYDHRFEYDRLRAEEFRRHEEWRNRRYHERFGRRFYRRFYR